jgi:hypothetical protein
MKQAPSLPFLAAHAREGRFTNNESVKSCCLCELECQSMVLSARQMNCSEHVVWIAPERGVEDAGLLIRGRTLLLNDYCLLLQCMPESI